MIRNVYMKSQKYFGSGDINCASQAGIDFGGTLIARKCDF